VLYAIHDALVKPMPAGQLTPCLAESWSASPDGLTYDFKLRAAKFHNGEPVTAEDVKFSFERYRGGAAALLKSKVKEVKALDARHVRFVLKEPWPDFMTFYGTTATGSAGSSPKKYVEKVGDDGFKKAPIGAGPYRFVSFNPGVELVLEAFDGYWRKAPAVKRVVMRNIPDETTRAAALKSGDADLGYIFTGPWPRSSGARRGCASPARAATRSSTSTSSSSGIRVAVGGPARTAGRQHGRRPQGDQRRRVPRLRRDHAQRRAAPHGVRPADRSAGLRPQAGPAIAGRGRLSHGFDGGDLSPNPPYFSQGEAIIGNLPRSASGCGCAPWSGQRG